MLKAAHANKLREGNWLREALWNQFHIQIRPSRAAAIIGDFLDFKKDLWYQELSQDALRYVVGSPGHAGLKQAYPHASHFYHVQALPGSALFFKDLFPSFSINMVRLQEGTVLPAGFKYAREVDKMDN
jgi:hypothetical protein